MLVTVVFGVILRSLVFLVAMLVPRGGSVRAIIEIGGMEARVVSHLFKLPSRVAIPEEWAPQLTAGSRTSSDLRETF
jgi:hypothetical protein